MELLLIAALAAAWGSGFAACRIFHRERGIEVDSWDIVVPSDPRDLAGVS